MVNSKLLIVTGLSGAGKTLAVRVLEDLGFFCVDNLPPMLLPKFSELVAQSGDKFKRAALVIDVRGGEFFETVYENLDTLQEMGVQFEILFLDASDEVLVRRFKQSRRSHPLGDGGRVVEGLKEERRRLEGLKGRASTIIDTSQLEPKALKEELVKTYGHGLEDNKLAINVVSFGFKHGIPMDSDIVIDVRFLPNPFYIKELKDFTGNDKQVQDYVNKYHTTTIFIRKFYSMVKFLIPQYIKEGKTTLTIAIGCTGGQHRSVTLVNRLAGMLKRNETAKGYRVFLKHRDIVKHTKGDC